MAWTDMLSGIVSGVSQVGQAALGYQTQKANLQAARAQLQASQAASANAPAPSPYQVGKEPDAKSGGMLSNPLLWVFAVVVVLGGLFAFMRKG